MLPLALQLTRSIRMQFGRCSVRTFYPAALQVLKDNLDVFKTFVENKISLDQAEEVSADVYNTFCTMG
jgi:hypothetical protein